MAEPGGARGEGASTPRGHDEDASPTPGPAIEIRAITFTSDHGMLEGCREDVGWRSGGAPCPEPAWQPEEQWPISHSLGEPVRLQVHLGNVEGGKVSAPFTLRGEGPGGLAFEAAGVSPSPGGGVVEVSSEEPLERKIQELPLVIRWSARGGGPVSPDQTEVTAYVTLGRPRRAPQGEVPEAGVTVRRMKAAVAWVAPLDTLEPHAIVAGLMDRFPGYALVPSPAVPDRFHHPTYFNDHGGAWAMAEYPEQSGECQAIVRFIRGVLWQLGVPGEARVVVFWASPREGGGEEILSANLLEQPRAGLDARKVVDGRRLVAALVDAPVEAGKHYPASHTRLEGGGLSPGLNRYEACLAFSHGGKERFYCGGAGTFDAPGDILRVFWGLVWVHFDEDGEGYTVEEIVARYGEASASGGMA